MSDGSSVCIAARGQLFGRRPTFFINGVPLNLRIKTNGASLSVYDVDGLLCSADGGCSVTTRQGNLSVGYSNSAGVWRVLEFGGEKWLWRLRADLRDIKLSRHFSGLRRWGGIKDRIFHCIENEGNPERRYLLSQRRHSLVFDISIESMGAVMDINFMMALMVFFWSELEEARRPY